MSHLDDGRPAVYVGYDSVECDFTRAHRARQWARIQLPRKRKSEWQFDRPGIVGGFGLSLSHLGKFCVGYKDIKYLQAKSTSDDLRPHTSTPSPFNSDQTLIADRSSRSPWTLQ